jgi:hypothetical protein
VLGSAYFASATSSGRSWDCSMLYCPGACAKETRAAPSEDKAWYSFGVVPWGWSALYVESRAFPSGRSRVLYRGLEGEGSWASLPNTGGVVLLNGFITMMWVLPCCSAATA